MKKTKTIIEIMLEKEIRDKSKYLKKNCPYYPIPKISDKVTCIHCNKSFMVSEYRVVLWRKEEYIVCKHFPECDGTIIDWIREES